MDLLYKLDLNFTNFINFIIPHNQLFTLFFSFFSQRGYSILIWIVILALLFIFEESRNHKFIIYFVLVFISSIILTTIIKDVVKRTRPCQNSLTTQQSNNYSCPSDYSFPSGHATTAFASAVVFAAFDKKRKWIYYLIAFLIGLSRIYLGVHYFFDVFVGAILGVSISLLIFKLGRKVKHFNLLK